MAVLRLRSRRPAHRRNFGKARRRRPADLRWRRPLVSFPLRCIQRPCPRVRPMCPIDSQGGRGRGSAWRRRS
jgi:hypothetical protein